MADRALQRRRSKIVERSFAHVCDTGGLRRMTLRGLDKVKKRYVIHAAAYNLALLMRKLCGVGTPRGLAARCSALLAALWSGLRCCSASETASPSERPVRRPRIAIRSSRFHRRR